MLYIKTYLQNEKFFISIMFSLMLNTLCSRLVDQTDLVMMRRVSEEAAAALISIKSISFIDFIVALATVPIFGIIVRKLDNRNKKEVACGILSKKFFTLAVLTTILCAIVYPILIQFSITDDIIKPMCFAFVPFTIINIPCKMMQFLFSTFLCVFKRANFVSIFWILNVALNFILNAIFMKIFGYTGCLIATVIVTFIVALSFFIKLSKDFHLYKLFFNKSNNDLSIPLKAIISEGLRIIVEQIGAYFFFIINMNFCSRSDFTNIGIMSALLNLLLVPTIAGMRATSLSLSKNNPSLKSKMCILCIFSIVVGIIFTVFFPLIIGKLYNVTDYRHGIYLMFRFAVPIILVTNAGGAILRGKMHFYMQQPLLFKIDGMITWFLYLPLCLILFINALQSFYAIVIVFQSITELGILIYFSRNRK